MMMKMVIVLVTLLEGMEWWYDDVQLNDDTWGGEWEWSNQGTIHHRFTTRWHFSEDVIIISPPWLLSQAIIMCVWLMYTWNRSRWVFHLNSRSWSGTSWVFYALRGFEGGRFAPSPIHCNARNAQHLNAPPPKLVDRHSPLLHPNLPNLQSKLPWTTPVLSGAKPTWHIDLISVKLAPRCRYNLAAPFLL